MEDLGLVACAGCKEAKVLKLGDYCIMCALEWPENEHYIIVTPKTMEKAIRWSGMAGEYLKAKSDQAFEKFQSYVIYTTPDGAWHEINVSDRFPVPYVMKNLLRKQEP